MKTTINLKKIHHTANGMKVEGVDPEEFKTIDEAREEAKRFLEDHPYHTCQIVRVCDDIDDDRYCQVVEVIETVEA